MAAIIAEGLRCPVCFEHLDNPKQLTCGHTFCEKCLDKLYRSEYFIKYSSKTDPSDSKREVTCPTCRVTTSISDGDVTKLSTNFTLKGMAEDMKTAALTCTNCDENNAAVAVSFCQNCGAFMCKACHEVHRKWKMNLDHDVVDVEDIKSGKVKIRQKCKKHPDDSLAYVCIECKLNLCFKCRILGCEKKGHDVIEEADYTKEIKNLIKNLERKAKSKTAIISKHINALKEQRETIKTSISTCKSNIEKAYNEAVAKLAEAKSALLRKCEEHESELLKQLDKLVQRDDELVSSLSNARELVGNGMKGLGTGHIMEAHGTLCDRLKDLLKTGDPDLMEATNITERGQMLIFKKREVDHNLGEVGIGEWKWKLKRDVDLCSKGDMRGMGPTKDGKMAVGFREGGIQIYSADGQLQQTVLKDVNVWGVAFLSDGRCVVRCVRARISLYTPDWEKLSVKFETHDDGSWGGVTVDSVDHIYVGYYYAKKIQIFTPSGGKPVREISCGGYQPWQICVIEPSKMLVVMTHPHTVRVLDQQGRVIQKIIQEKYAYPTVCKNETILIARVNNERDRVSIGQYTNELKYMKTLITDHVITETNWAWYYLREFSSGELALCTEKRLHIFHKTLSSHDG